MRAFVQLRRDVEQLERTLSHTLKDHGVTLYRVQMLEDRLAKQEVYISLLQDQIKPLMKAFPADDGK